MSDPAAEPGAPTGPQSIPPAADKSVSSEVQKKAPKLVGLLATPDRLILRLNKLIAAPGGLSSLLSTFNYTLYILTHLEAKSVPLKLYLQILLNPDGEIEFKPPGPSKIAALASMLSTARTTLRLFGLPPLYAWLRSLMQGPKPGEDQVLYTNAVTQCIFYILFQFLENVALLTDSKVLPPSFTARWTEQSGGKTDKIYLWSYRFWFLGVACDIVRLAREAQLEQTKRSKRTSAEKKDVDNQDADVKVNAKWRSDLVSPLAWLPMAYHFAAWTPEGLPGFNLGYMGVMGWVAGIQKFKALWDATA